MSEAKNIQLNVQGMTCEGCVNAVTRVVKKRDPEAAVKIELASGNVDIESALDPAVLAEAIEKAGYKAQVR